MMNVKLEIYIILLYIAFSLCFDKNICFILRRLLRSKVI